MRYPRITANADQMGGVPCIRGLRIPVATVVGMVSSGMSTEEILQAYPDLGVEDVGVKGIVGSRDGDANTRDGAADLRSGVDDDGERENR